MEDVNKWVHLAVTELLSNNLNENMPCQFLFSPSICLFYPKERMKANVYAKLFIKKLATCY